MSTRTSEETAGITKLGSKQTNYDYNYQPELLETFVNKQLFFVTPIKMYQTNVWSCNTPYAKNSLGKSLKDYSDIIKEVCEYYSIPVIDMFSLSGMNPTMEWSLFADTDGKHVHPNAAGHQRMASVATPIIGNSRA